MSNPSRHPYTLSALALVLLAHGVAQAAVVRWNDPAGGSFNDPANWFPLVLPGEADTALLNLATPSVAPYVVSGFNTSVNRLVVGQDSVRFDFDRIGRLRLTGRDAAAPGLVVGELAGQQGVLTLFDGGSVIGEHAAIGLAAGSSGALNVDSSRVELTRSVSLGSSTANRLALSNDATMRAGSLSMGAGTLNVQASTLTIDRSFDIGGDDAITLELGPGARITSGNTTLDPQGGLGDGAVFGEITGANTRWDILGRLVVREQGMWVLNFESGAVLRTGEAVLDGSSNDGTAVSTLWVDGPGTSWTASGAVDFGNVGWGSTGIRSGGFASASRARLGVESGALGIVSVDGTNSRFEIGGPLEVGLLGRGILRLRAGGTLEAGELIMGDDGEATVRGSSTLLDIAGDGTVDGVLELSSGGDATFGGKATLGSAAGRHGSARVTGIGSEWTVGSELHVGLAGEGELFVSDGGKVASKFGYVGSEAGSTGSVDISGTGSLWEITEELQVGAKGSGSLTILDGGLVTGRLARLAAFDTGVGAARIAGRGSEWQLDEILTVARQGQADLLIEQGGVVRSVGGFVASGSGAARGNVTITGDDSAWHVAGNFYIGGPGFPTQVFDLIGGVGGVGNVTLRDGGLLEVTEGLRIQATSTLRIDGGTLSLEQLDNLGSFLFDAGTLRVTAADFRIGARGGLPGFFERTLTLSGDRHLDVANAEAVIDTTGTLNLIDGASFEAPSGRNAGSILVDDATLRFGDGDLVNNGSLVVRSFGRLEIGRDLPIGDAPSQHGSVVLDGVGSRIDVARDLSVGATGSGSLEITGGALLEVDGDGNIAAKEGSRGKVLLRGFGSALRVGGELTVGSSTGGGAEIDIGRNSQIVVTGTTTLHDNSRLHLDGGALRTLAFDTGGRFAFTSGLLDLTGVELLVRPGGGVPGWFDSRLVLGPQQRLSISGGGVAVSQGGEVEIDGVDAGLIVRDAVLLGRGGGHGSITVANGGLLSNGSVGFVGDSAGTSGAVTVRGTRSRWRSTNNVVIGNFGSGTLDVLDGGSLTTRDLFVGGNAGADGRARVAGAESMIDLAGALNVGLADEGQLDVADGGEVTLKGTATLGSQASGDGKLNVSGTNALLDVGGSLIVGDAGKGELSVTRGGQVKSASGTLGAQAAGEGEALVSGAGSRWDNTGILLVGNAGRGTLEAADGGVVTAGDELRLGENSSGEGELRAAGPATRIEVKRDVTVGLRGTGTLELSDGAVLDVDGNGEIADAVGSVGRVVLTGQGTRWDNALDLAVGLRGDGELEVTDGATIDTQVNGMVGHQASATGRASVSGSGSEWAIGETLFVGFVGDGELTVADGAKVTAKRFATIANGAVSRGRAVVTGAGSELNIGASLLVGDANDGGLIVSDGATVTTQQNGIIGSQTAARGRMVVTGRDSAWSLRGSIFVGNQGIGELLIADGAAVTTENLNDTWIGNVAGSTGTIELRGRGARLSTDQLVVGYFGDGELRVLDGAVMSSRNTWIGFGTQSESSARVAGGGEWLIETFLDVGTSGTARLDIVDGGVVRTKNSYVAEELNGEGTITIAGKDAAWFTRDDFLLGGKDDGRSGGVGDVAIRNGGLLEVGDKLQIFDRSRLTLDGGTLRVGKLDSRGELLFESGTLEFTASDLRIGGAGSTPAPFGSSLLLTDDKHVNVVNGRTDLGLDGILGVLDGTSFASRGGRNDGAILADSSTVHFTAAFENAGTFSATNATLRFDGGLSNTGAMRLMGARVEGDVHNEAAIVLSGANDFTGALSGNGVFAGTGSASLAGSLNPGNSPGLVSFGGDVSFEDTHMLTIELAGREGGVSHDQIRVAGRLTLGGTLDVDLLDDYAPLLGDTFDIAIAAFIDGEFADLLLPTLASGLRWRTLQLSDALGRELYRLEVSAVPVPPAVWMLGSACVVIVARVRRR